MELHTIAAWNIMDMIGVRLILAGEFAQALARLLWNGQCTLNFLSFKCKCNEIQGVLNSIMKLFLDAMASLEMSVRCHHLML